MIYYILLLGIVIVAVITTFIVIKLWQKQQQLLAVLLSAIVLILCSGVIWYSLNEQAESKPPGADPTATASSQYIKDLKVDKKTTVKDTSPSYSDTNKDQNREAVEKFKTLPVIE